jgi:hypothetical protein
MPLPLVVACVLLLIVLFFLYVFVFRLPSSQITQEAFKTLQELFADTSPDSERITLLLRSREPQAGELMALVVVLKEYEMIDLSKQILPRAFETYFNEDNERVLWREKWEQSDYDTVHRASKRAFAQKLIDLKSDGYRVMFQLPFSLVDELVYLKRANHE